jgi:transposase
MSKARSENGNTNQPQGRRRYTQEFKEQAVRMVLDGHSVASVCQWLELPSPNLLYNWKCKLVE